MNLTVHQNIIINCIKITGITNSSVFQIGSAGIIKASSKLHNTGGFTEPAPRPGEPPSPLVPLQAPSEV